MFSGNEYGVGIYITHIDQNSLAEKKGLFVGDRLLRVNGICTDGLTHEEILGIMTKSHELTLIAQYAGVLPYIKYVGFLDTMVKSCHK